MLRDTDYEQDILKPKNSPIFAFCDLLDSSSITSLGHLRQQQSRIGNDLIGNDSNIEDNTNVIQ